MKALSSLLLLVLSVCSCSSPTASSSTPQPPPTTVSGAVVTTLAGSTASGSSDGTGTLARFNNPFGVATDGTNLFVADTHNNMIRQVVIQTGVVTTLAGSTTSGSSNGAGASAGFNTPEGVATDGTTLYVADTYNNMIRQVVIQTGVVTTLAGSTTSGTADGTGVAARFNLPSGLATDGTNLYIADFGNHLIRKLVINTGVVTTLAGSTSGSANGTGTAASFNLPAGLATDGTNLYIADSGNHMIRKLVLGTGLVSTLAGSTNGGSVNGTGTAARFADPSGVATDGTNLYVADTLNCLIRKVVISTAVVSTWAGSTTTGSANGTGSTAGFYQPQAVAMNANAPTRLFVADTFNNLIRLIQ